MMTGAAAPNHSTRYPTWVDLCQARAAEQPDHVVYRFLTDGESEQLSLTHARLDRRARAIAALLQELNAAGKRALVIHPPGLDFITAFLGCLYSDVVAVPTYPPRSARHARLMNRLEAVAHDARPAFVLTTTAQRPLIEACLAQIPHIDARCVTTNDVSDDRADTWRRSEVTPDRLACLQYTSGSTGAPRGVMLSHANLLNNSELICRRFGHGHGSVGLIWLPPYHDMGLIGGVLQPVYAGFPVTLMAPAAFLQRPARWLEAITRYKATTSGGPSSGYELCLNRISDAELAALDLSSWEVAFNGSETVHHQTLERFASTFEPHGFRRSALYPCYGLAEATLMVTSGRKLTAPVYHKARNRAVREGRAIGAETGDDDTRTLVGCGQSWGDTTIRIVDPENGQESLPDTIGEIWVSGASVAHGYWDRTHPGRPLRTGFNARLVGSGRRGDQFLCTGDLGFLHGGELFVTGRLKDQIIIAGINHDPVDIELTASASHQALRTESGAAFAVEIDGQERVVIVHEVARMHRHTDLHRVIDLVRRSVSEQHEISLHGVVLVKPGQVSRTPSGKIQRHACRSAFLNGGFEVLAVWQQDHRVAADVFEYEQSVAQEAERDGSTVKQLESWLLSRLATALELTEDQIDPAEPFSRYGLDSFTAAEIAMDIADRLERPLPPSLFWDYPCIADLARFLAEDGMPTAPPRVKVDRE